MSFLSLFFASPMLIGDLNVTGSPTSCGVTQTDG